MIDYAAIFIENIVREMAQRGIKSQRALADKSGINRGDFSSLLNRKKQWNIWHYQSISEAIGVPLHILLTPKHPEDEVLNDKEVRECLELMVNLPKFRRGILSKADELKAQYKDEIAALKKAAAGSPIMTTGDSARTPSQ